MAQVSKYPVSQKVYQRILGIFFQSVVKIRNRKEAEEFFNDFLTPTERIMLAKRLSIAVLLTKNYDYNSIRKILRVSPPTIAAVSTLLKYTGKGYKRVMKKLLQDEAIKDFLLGAIEGIATVGSRGGKGSGDWWRLKRKIQEKRSQKLF
jgi:TrpR-related protein YerC/YecD